MRTSFILLLLARNQQFSIRLIVSHKFIAFVCLAQPTVCVLLRPSTTAVCGGKEKEQQNYIREREKREHMPQGMGQGMGQGVGVMAEPFLNPIILALKTIFISVSQITKMSLVVVKVNDHHCRAVIATNFTHSFCGAGLVKSLKLTVNELKDSPAAVTTSEGIPIEFLGQTLVQLEFGPWRSNGFMPILIAFDCPADMLIGQDMIDEISMTFPIKFEYHKNAVNVGGTRVSMLDPTVSEEKFLSVRVIDPRNSGEIGLETWKRGVRESIEMGGLVKRRVEVMRGANEEEEERARKQEEAEKKEEEKEGEDDEPDSDERATGENKSDTEQNDGKEEAEEPTSRESAEKEGQV